MLTTLPTTKRRRERLIELSLIRPIRIVVRMVIRMVRILAMELEALRRNPNLRIELEMVVVLLLDYAAKSKSPPCSLYPYYLYICGNKLIY
jgi:hypothetical protein